MNAITPPDPHAARVAKLFGDHRAILAQIANLDAALATHRIAAALRAGHLGEALDLLERDRAAHRAPLASRATGDRLADAVRAGMRHTGDAAPEAALAALRGDPSRAEYEPETRPGFLPCPAHTGG